MNDTVTKLLDLADDYAYNKAECMRHEYESWHSRESVQQDLMETNNARQALQDELVRLFTPLTREQVKGILSDSGYEDAETDALCDFINGIRYGEICHGITGEKNEAT